MKSGGTEPVVYDRIARQLHWFNAILALITVMLAWGIPGVPRHSDARTWLITLHGSFGIVILVLMMVWAGWRLRHASPSLRPALTWIEVVLARATQMAIFLLFVAMPVSGYVSLAAAGKVVSLFSIIPLPSLVPESGRVSQAAIALHLLGEFLIYGLVTFHIAAALLHGFVRRDAILQRMLPPLS
jgi:cytochrome b561